MGPRPRHRAVVRAAAATLAALPALPEGQAERAIRALRDDRSLKVRAQAALVLAQQPSPEAVEALSAALASDDAAAVRIAAAASLGKIGDHSARQALESARKSDPESRVREAAAQALEELDARGARRITIEEVQGRGGDAARRALHAALSRHLAHRGFAVVDSGDHAAWRIKPSVLAVDVLDDDGRTTIAVRASAVAVDGQGRMAAMIESAARLKASGGGLGAARERELSTRALDAAARTLSEDLAARLR